MHGRPVLGRRDAAAARGGLAGARGAAVRLKSDARVVSDFSPTPALPDRERLPSRGERRTTASSSRGSSASSRKALARSTGSTSASSPARSTGSSGRTAPASRRPCHMLTTLLPPTAGTARVAGYDVVAEGPEGARDDRRCAPGGRARRAPHRTRPPPSPDDAPGPAAGRARGRARRAARARRAHGGGGPQGRRLLGRHEAAARPRARARPPAACPLPRRADDRASTRRAAPRSGTRSRASHARTASRSSSRRSTSRRPTSSPTASGSSTTGRIVAEGTPTALKAEIGRPSVHAIAATRRRTRRGSRSCSTATASRSARRRARRPPRRRASGSPTSSAGSTRRASSSTTSSSGRRRLDDVFLAKTGRTLEGAAEAETP